MPAAPTFSASAELPLPADPDPTSTEQPAPGSIWDGWTTDINSPRLVLELLVRNMLAAGPFRSFRLQTHARGKSTLGHLEQRGRRH